MGEVRYPVFRTHKSFFFDNAPPAGFVGWDLAAFQVYCREEMLEAGFDLTRKIQCRYDSRSGMVVFWQEPYEVVEFSYSAN